MRTCAAKAACQAILAMAVSVLCAGPSHSGDRSLERRMRHTFYPSAELRVRPAPSLQARQLRVKLESEISGAASSEQLIDADPDGSFRTTLDCPFYGPGTLEISDASLDPADAMLDPMPIACLDQAAESSLVLPDSQNGFDPSANGDDTSSSDLGESTTTVNAVVTGYRFFRRAEDTVTTTVSDGSSTSSTRTTVTTNTQLRSYDGLQICTLQVNIRQEDDLPPRRVEQEICNDAPASLNSLRLDPFVQEESRTSIEQFFNPPMTTETISATRVFDSFELTLDFPELSPNARIQELRALANTFRATDPFDAFPIDGVNPSGTEISRFVSTCDPTIEGRNWIWRIPEPARAEDGSVSLRMEPFPHCPNSANGTLVFEGPFSRTTQIVNGVLSHLDVETHFEADVASSRLELVLSPVDPTIGPRIPGTLRAPAGSNPTSALRASLLGGSPGDEHTVRFAIIDFDAQAAGHDHDDGLPPRHQRGELDNGEEAFCTLIVADGPTPQGSCEVVYQAGEFSGVATVSAELDSGAARGETTVEIALPLVDVSTLFPRRAELSVALALLHPEPFFLSPIAASFITSMQRDWEFVSASPLHPAGSYLSFGNMSLASGGRFDLDGNWDGAFGAHRRGHGVDVNQATYDAATQSATALRAEKRMVEELCRRHLGYAEMRIDGVHCDWSR